jgi:hypothetical protein
MDITIHGPNLADQSRGDFEIHAAGCQHGVRYLAGLEGDPLELEDAIFEDAVLAVYADQLAEGANFDSCAADFHVAPCLRGWS